MKRSWDIDLRPIECRYLARSSRDSLFSCVANWTLLRCICWVSIALLMASILDLLMPELMIAMSDPIPVAAKIPVIRAERFGRTGALIGTLGSYFSSKMAASWAWIVIASCVIWSTLSWQDVIASWWKVSLGFFSTKDVAKFLHGKRISSVHAALAM